MPRQGWGAGVARPWHRLPSCHTTHREGIPTMRNRELRTRLLADTVTLSPEARCLLLCLHCMADSEGRLIEDAPGLEALGIADPGPALDELDRTGFVVRYDVEGETAAQICNWATYQRPHHREPASSIDAPPEGMVFPGRAPCAQGAPRAPRARPGRPGKMPPVRGATGQDSGASAIDNREKGPKKGRGRGDGSNPELIALSASSIPAPVIQPSECGGHYIPPGRGVWGEGANNSPQPNDKFGVIGSPIDTSRAGPGMAPGRPEGPEASDHPTGHASSLSGHARGLPGDPQDIGTKATKSPTKGPEPIASDSRRDAFGAYSASTSALPIPGEFPIQGQADVYARWEGFLARWSATRNALPWHGLTPPSLFVERWHEPGFDQHLDLALSKLAASTFFDAGVSLTQFIRRDWMDRLIGGEFDKKFPKKGEAIVPAWDGKAWAEKEMARKAAEKAAKESKK